MLAQRDDLGRKEPRRWTPAHPSPVHVYSASPIKRFRRTKAAVTSIRDAICEVLQADHPQTVRQVFYALTVRGVIKKVEIEYHRTVIRLLTEMREAGDVPFSWIADNTRWQRKPSTFVGLEHCLNSTAEFYRRDLWEAMPVYVEVWCEKDALAGVLLEETKTYDVPLMVARGYASRSLPAQCGEDINPSMQASIHLPSRRHRPVRAECRPRHRGQAPPLRARG